MFPSGAEPHRGRIGAPDDRDYTCHDYLQEALILRGMGFTVIPLGADKKPTGRWKHVQERKPHDREICRAFERGASRLAGLAAVHGAASGYWGRKHAVRDFETLGEYREWADENPALAADAPTALRPGGGAHVHVMLRSGPELFIDFRKLGGNGELRAKRTHYTALPPSRHPRGVRYYWRDGPPVGRSDFPTVPNWAATGFLPATAHATAVAPKLSRTRPRSQPLAPNGLCPREDIRGYDTLPRAVQEAVLRTLPRGPGERESRLFALARALYAIDPNAPAPHWAAAVDYWWAAARPFIATQEREPTWRAFTRAWSRCDRTTADTLPMVTMAEAAEAAGDNPAARLRAACVALASFRPDGVFSLACRTAAGAAGIGRTLAAQLLSDLCRSGFLDLVTPGTRGAYARRASEYQLGATATLEATTA